MKRALAVLLVLALLLTVPVIPFTPAEAAANVSKDDNVTSLSELCPCPCGKKLSEVEWKPWDAGGPSGNPSEGHYYLDGNFTQEAIKTIIANSHLVLDLRGNTWTTATAHKLLEVEGYFYILDTVGGGLVAPKINYAASGGAFLVKMNEWEYPTLTLCSGTIMAGVGSNAAALSLNGGLISLGSRSRFVMTGGRLIGHSTTDNGGAIASVSSAEILIHGGELIGGHADGSGGVIYSQGKLVLENCRIVGGTAGVDGGAVYASGDTTVNNCVITGGEATRFGGNLCMSGGKLRMEDTLLGNGIAHGIKNAAGDLAASGGGGNLMTMPYGTTSCDMQVKDSVLRGGYSGIYGGNFSAFANAEQTFIGTTFQGGVSVLTGGNIGCSAATVTTLDGCTVEGDAWFNGGSLTLTGKTSIGLRNTGLRLKADAGIDASGLAEGSMVYLDGTGALVKPGANISYFRGAIRTTLTGGGDAAITGTTAANGASGGYCPHCNQIVKWSAFAGKYNAGHYYFGKDMTGTSAKAMWVSDADVVIDMAGCDLDAASAKRAAGTGGTGSLTLLDSKGGSIVQSGGKNGEGGGVVNNGANATVRIYGGKYVYVPAEGVTVSSGAILYNQGTMEIHGGIFDASAYDNTGASGGALAIYAARGEGKGTSTTISAGYFVGGSVKNGAAVAAYCHASNYGTGNDLQVTGGIFVGGTAANAGGTIALIGTGDMGDASIENALIRGGTAKNGGSLFVTAQRASVENCCITGGKAVETDEAGGAGGNVYVSTGGVLSVTDSTVVQGNATKGGNVYQAATNSQLTLTDTLLLAGRATANNGGNLYVNNGQVTIRGGELSCGRAAAYGGNIFVNTGRNSDTVAQTVTVEKSQKGVTRITGGSGSRGGNLHVLGTVELKDAFLGNGKANAGMGGDIYINTAASGIKLTLGSGVTGNMVLGAIDGIIPAPTYGVPVANTEVTGQLNAVITLDGDFGAPQLLEKDGVLYVAVANTEDAEGNVAWYATAADALAASDEGHFAKLFVDSALALNKDAYLDLNGKNVAVTGNYRVYGKDSSGDDYSVPTGKLTFENADTVTDNMLVFTADGSKYMALTEGSTATFHRLGMDLSTVTLRVGDRGGVLYKGDFGCDEVLRGEIKTYGIAVSLNAMPTAALDNGTLTASYDGAELEAENGRRQGVVITNIMKDSLTNAENDRRGRNKIYATAYIQLQDGTVLVSDRTGQEDDIGNSLYDVVNKLDALIENDPTNFRRYTNTLRDYYARWNGKGMEGWLGADTNLIAPPDDGVIDILMIGSSWCSYYSEEIWGIANSMGVEVRVCNVYYSGCPMTKYYNDWVAGKADYSFFEATGLTRKSYGSGKTLEWCLARGEWDVITMQESGFNHKYGQTAQEHWDEMGYCADALLSYMREQFPETTIYFHQTWSYQKGYNKNGLQVTTDQWQAEQVQQNKDFANILRSTLNEKYPDLNIGRIATGEAWQLVREGWGGFDPYDKLCARLGTSAFNQLTGYTDPDDPHEGDYSHDGDIGGGQYLNGLVWFLQIMKDRGVEYTADQITWEPSYSSTVANRFNGEQLRQAAWEVVYGNGWSYDSAKYE